MAIIILVAIAVLCIAFTFVVLISAIAALDLLGYCV